MLLTMGTVWLLFAGGCFVVSCAWLRRLVLLSRRGVPAAARIVQCERKQVGDGAGWFSTFSFIDSRGRDISVRRSLGTGRFKEGQQVGIIYDSARPERLRVVRDFEWEWFFGFFAFTLVHAGAASLLIRQAFKA